MDALLTLRAGSSSLKSAVYPAQGDDPLLHLGQIERQIPLARSHNPYNLAGIKAIEDQMKHGKTTLIKAIINQELGDPFRRDAMKKPAKIAGISADDMIGTGPKPAP